MRWTLTVTALLFGAAGYTAASPFQFIGINDSGQIVGTYSSGAFTSSVLYNPATQTFTYFNPPGAGPGGSGANGINNSGQISGQGSTASGAFAYIKTGDSYTTFTYPNVNNTFAGGISGNGTVTGTESQRNAQCLSDASCPKAGFIWNGTVIASNLTYQGLARTSMAGINNSATLAVGWGDVVNNTIFAAFIYNISTAQYTSVAFPGADSTIAYGVNDSGEVVGAYMLGSQIFGFTYLSGVYNTIMYPGADSTIVYGISNNGNLVGSYTCPSGPCSTDPPFYATLVDNTYTFTTVPDPAPEPSTGALLLSGLGVAALFRRWRPSGRQLRLEPRP